MKLLEKILIPIDSESNSKDQLNLALSIADKFNSELIILKILPNEAKIESVNSIIVEYVQNEFDKILNKVSEKKIKAHARLVYGNEFEQILSTSEQENVNLILINDITSDESIGNYKTDILTEKLIRKSEKPVWVLKKGSTQIPSKLLCPIDYSDASARALNNAIKIARTFDAHLSIVNVFEPLQESFSVRLNINYKEENMRLEGENQEKFNEFLKQFNLIEVEYTTNVLVGKPSKKIVEYVNTQNIDLLFMGATGKSLLQRMFLGSVTEQVIRALPCAMVISKSENLLNLRIDADISNLEKHYKQALKLQETGYYNEAIDQLKICLKINDLHIPALNALIKIYKKLDQTELADIYSHKLNEILRRLWDKKIELEIRRNLNL